MDRVKMTESKYLKKDIPEFSPGDTLKVFLKIVEEGKQRLQAFEGLVIAKKGSGMGETFTLRRVSYGEGVERTFSINSPSIDKISLVRKGVVKRAKLYYLRKKIGGKTMVEEKIGAGTKKQVSS
jgi:large subunit ribosomal protein L19